MVLPVFAAPRLPEELSPVNNRRAQTVFSPCPIIKDSGQMLPMRMPPISASSAACRRAGFDTVQPVISVSIMGQSGECEMGAGAANSAF